jgi:hypothetical protein
MGQAIIGISGKKQAGKTTLAEYLRAWHYCRHVKNTVVQEDDGKIWITDEYGVKYPEQIHDEDWADYAVHLTSFADPLKNFLIEVMGLSHEQCYGSNEDKETPTKYSWERLPLSIREEFQIRCGPMSARHLMQVWGTNIMRRMFSDTIWVDATLRQAGKLSSQIIIIPDVRFASEIHAIMRCSQGYVIRLLRSVFQDGHASETELDKFDFSQYGNKALVINNQNLSIQQKNKQVIPFFSNIVEAIDDKGSFRPLGYE